MSETNYRALILFDGVCNLCNGSVRFIIDHDKQQQFTFAALQSEAAQRILDTHGVEPKMESIILVENGHVSTRSTAALRIAKRLNGIWSLLYIFILLPAFIRDPVYSLIARNRYKIFGRTEACMIPTPELKRRFID